MPKHASHPLRPPAGGGTSIGIERFRLLRAAFQHAQQATHEGRYLEAIALLESILTDRLGSLVHGSLGERVTLRHTLGELIAVAKSNTVVPRPNGDEQSKRSRRNPLSIEVIHFVDRDLSRWWQMRSEALHGMAKLQRAGDRSFRERYAALRETVLTGFVFLLQLDAYDQSERAANRAVRSASWPNAFATDRELEAMLFKIRPSAS